MTIEEFIQLNAVDNVAKLIQKLQQGKPFEAQPEAAKKEIDVFQHGVMSSVHRPDKIVITDVETPDGTLRTTERLEKVGRVPLAMQKLISSRMAAFTFGLSALNNCDTEDENETRVFDSVKRVFDSNRIDSFNLKAADTLYSFTEIAECWWLEEKQNTEYGFNCPFAVKVSLFSPNNGDTLYPYFDERGKMVAFSRQFVTKDFESGKEVTNFETYTDTAHYLWTLTGGQWQSAEGYPRTNALGKIPIVYAYQLQTEWHDVQPLIERLEKLLSNFADTNDYHASPKIFVRGHINGFAAKGETGAILEGDTDSSAEYLSWTNAPESVKLEIDTLWRNIHTLTQIPDISWDSVKGVNVSGVALKLMFSDTHLKVRAKRAIWDEYLSRRINVVKTILQLLAPDAAFAMACNSVQITPEIVPFMLDDEQSTINALMAATGQKAIMSRQTAVRTLNYTSNPDREMERIEEEEAQSAISELSNLTQM